MKTAGKTLCIGIAGGTGSGKTTITERIARTFEGKVSVLYHDSYYLARDGLPLSERAKLNYDHPDAFFFDIKIFVDTDADVRILRRMLRDTSERGRTVESVVTQYLATVKPMHELFVEPTKKFADVIIPEGGYNDVALEMIIQTIAGHIERCGN